MHSGARNCSLRLLPSWMRSAGVPNCPTRSGEVFPMSWPATAGWGAGGVGAALGLLLGPGRAGREQEGQGEGWIETHARDDARSECRRARLPERTAKARRRAFPHSFGDFMPDRRLDVLAIGNAIVDVIADADDAFLAREGMHKGAMRLLDEGEATTLYDAMGAGRELSGGSAANTAAGIAALGAARGLRRPACERPTWRDFPARHPEPGSRFRHAAQGRCRRHRALPDPGDAGCAADDEHLPRRSANAGAGSGRPRRSSRTPRSCISKAICGTRRNPARR